MYGFAPWLWGWLVVCVEDYIYWFDGEIYYSEE
jgi:hypothetical protein